MPVLFSSCLIQRRLLDGSACNRDLRELKPQQWHQVRKFQEIDQHRCGDCSRREVIQRHSVLSCSLDGVVDCAIDGAQTGGSDQAEIANSINGSDCWLWQGGTCDGFSDDPQLLATRITLEKLVRGRDDRDVLVQMDG
jgi:hypothetical protein